jgi:hypothetical protein
MIMSTRNEETIKYVVVYLYYAFAQRIRYRQVINRIVNYTFLLIHMLCFIDVFVSVYIPYMGRRLLIRQIIERIVFATHKSCSYFKNKSFLFHFLIKRSKLFKFSNSLKNVSNNVTDVHAIIVMFFMTLKGNRQLWTQNRCFCSDLKCRVHLKKQRNIIM